MLFTGANGVLIDRNKVISTGEKISKIDGGTIDGKYNCPKEEIFEDID